MIPEIKRSLELLRGVVGATRALGRKLPPLPPLLLPSPRSRPDVEQGLERREAISRGVYVVDARDWGKPLVIFALCGSHAFCALTT